MKKIDLTASTSSDPLGRVRPQDVEAASTAQHKQLQHSCSSQSKQQLQLQEMINRIEVIKMTRRRQTIAKRLVEVNKSAMLTTFNEVDMTAIMNCVNAKKSFVEKMM